MVADNAVTFKLQGDDPGNDFVRAGDFVAFLQRILASLSAVDRAVNGKESKYFQIVDLSISSASAALAERVDAKAKRRSHILADVRPKFAELVAGVERGMVPDWVDPDVLIKLRELAEPIGHVRFANIRVGNASANLDETFRRKIERIIGRDVTTVGEMVGTLDAVNFHDQNRAFLYPRRGEPRIPCDFPLSLKETVRAALSHRVRITGDLKRRENDERPYEIKIRELTILPDESELPLFASLFGSSSNYPADTDPVEMVRSLRDAD